MFPPKIKVSGWDVPIWIPHSLPVGAIEGAVLDGFGNVAGLDFLDTLEVGHGAGDAQDAVVSARGQAEARDRIFHLLLALGVELAESAQGARRHLSIAVQPEGFQAPGLDLPGSDYALPNSSRILRFLVLRQILVFDGRHLDVKIEAVEQRAGDSREVALDERRSAGALVQRIAVKTALVRMHNLARDAKSR